MNLTYYTDGNGFFYQGDQIEESHREATREEIKDYEKSRKSEQKRFERNNLLIQTDKLMIVDYPISEAEKQRYIEYRQYLRDIPSIKAFPDVEIKSFDDWNY